jgi:hypothetical protein
LIDLLLSKKNKLTGVRISFFVNESTGSKKTKIKKIRARERKNNNKYLLKFDTGGKVYL